MSFGFYVWYRVEPDLPDAEIAIRGMMARLACRTGISGRLLKKREEPGLWMEVYEDVADPTSFQARLGQAVDEFDIEMFVDGGRHTECFEAAQENGAVEPACCSRKSS